MPACVAHHQFGEDFLARLAGDLKTCILAHRAEFDIGLQGPDIFFFYRPYRKNDVVDYGVLRHKRPAIEMFAPILTQTRQGAALSYMVGLICHYTLDALCHPYIDGHSLTDLDHHRMEAAFDRHIMSQRRTMKSRHLLAHTSRLDVDAMAALWPGVDARTVRECLWWRRFLVWLVDREGMVRIAETIPRARGLASALTLPSAVPLEQQENMRRLDELFSEALLEAPRKVHLAEAAMGSKPVNLAGFETNYEGEIVHEQGREKLDIL